MRFRREAAHWFILIGAAAMGVMIFVFLIDGIWLAEDRWIISIVSRHYAATVGGPMMAIAAFIIVSAFRMTSGEINFQFLAPISKEHQDQ